MLMPFKIVLPKSHKKDKGCDVKFKVDNPPQSIYERQESQLNNYVSCLCAELDQLEVIIEKMPIRKIEGFFEEIEATRDALWKHWYRWLGDEKIELASRGELTCVCYHQFKDDALTEICEKLAVVALSHTRLRSRLDDFETKQQLNPKKAPEKTLLSLREKIEICAQIHNQLLEIDRLNLQLKEAELFKIENNRQVIYSMSEEAVKQLENGSHFFYDMDERTEAVLVRVKELRNKAVGPLIENIPGDTALTQLIEALKLIQQNASNDGLPDYETILVEAQQATAALEDRKRRYLVEKEVEINSLLKTFNKINQLYDWYAIKGKSLGNFDYLNATQKDIQEQIIFIKTQSLNAKEELNELQKTAILKRKEEFSTFEWTAFLPNNPLNKRFNKQRAAISLQLKQLSASTLEQTDENYVKSHTECSCKLVNISEKIKEINETIKNAKELEKRLCDNYYQMIKTKIVPTFQAEFNRIYLKKTSEDSIIDPFSHFIKNELFQIKLDEIDQRLLKLLKIAQDFESENERFISKKMDYKKNYKQEIDNLLRKYIIKERYEDLSEDVRNRFIQWLRRILFPMQRVCLIAAHRFFSLPSKRQPTVGACTTEKVVINLANALEESGVSIEANGTQKNR